MNLVKRLGCTAGFYTGGSPAIERIEGRYTVIERLSKEKHGADLYQVYMDSQQRCGPFCSKALPAMREEWDHLLDDLMTAKVAFLLCDCRQKIQARLWGLSLSCGSIKPTG